MHTSLQVYGSQLVFTWYVTSDQTVALVQLETGKLLNVKQVHRTWKWKWQDNKFTDSIILGQTNWIHSLLSQSFQFCMRFVSHYSDFRLAEWARCLCSISQLHRPIIYSAQDRGAGLGSSLQGTVYLLYCIWNLKLLQKFWKLMQAATINCEFSLPGLM